MKFIINAQKLLENIILYTYILHTFYIHTSYILSYYIYMKIHIVITVIFKMLKPLVNIYLIKIEIQS